MAAMRAWPDFWCSFTAVHYSEFAGFLHTPFGWMEGDHGL